MGVRVGCCGWPVARERYFRAFDLFEVQESFYNCVDPFQRLPVWGEPAYFRLHGKGGYHYRHSDAELEDLLGLCRGRRLVYVLFNNTEMFRDARRFLRLF